MAHIRIAVLGSLTLILSASAQDDANARVDKLLAGLAAQGTIVSTTVTKNPMYEQRLRAAGAARLANMKRFEVRAIRQGDVSIWIAEETSPRPADQKPERYLLARKGARWISKDQGGSWQLCLRPSGVWQSAFLPDVGFLAASLRQILPKTKWKATTATEDERLVRLFSTELDAEQVKRLLGAGALPETSDYMSGMGLVGRRYIGRVVRQGKRTAKVRISVGPKSKTTRIAIDLFQSGVRMTAGGIAVRAVGGRVLPAGPARKGNDDKDQNPPSLVTTITLSDAKGGEGDLLDENARALLTPK